MITTRLLLMDEPTVSVSISRKINFPGKFESVDIFFSLNGLPVDTSEEEMMELLKTGENAFFLIREKVVEKTAELRSPGDTGPEDWNG